MCSLKAEGCWVAVVFKLNYTTLIRTVGIILAYTAHSRSELDMIIVMKWRIISKDV